MTIRKKYSMCKTMLKAKGFERFLIGLKVFRVEWLSNLIIVAIGCGLLISTIRDYELNGNPWSVGFSFLILLLISFTLFMNLYMCVNSNSDSSILKELRHLEKLIAEKKIEEELINSYKNE